MAEVNAKDLTTKTTPASTDSMLLFGTTSNEGAKITVDNLADNILGRLTTKTFANQVGGSSAATLLAQLSTLNSNLIANDKNKITASGNLDNYLPQNGYKSGFYFPYGVKITGSSGSQGTIYGAMILITGNPSTGDGTVQIIIDYSNIFFRSFVGGTPTWQDWRQVTRTNY